MATPSNISDDCLAAAASTNDLGYNIVRAAQLLLGLLVNVLLVKIICYYRKNPINLHANLLIIVISVLIIYAAFVWSFIVMTFRNFVLLLTYTEPCQCLTPVWLVYLVRMPFYVYIAASPMLHLAITVERVRATVFVRSYEREGHSFGIGIISFVFLLTLAFCIYVYCSSIVDSALTGHGPMVYFTLTSQFNSSVLIYVHYFFLSLVICISVVDYQLIRMNKKMKKNFKVEDYSLSRTYQTNENILTMRIIFPLDFSYTIFFSVFNILSYYIRSQRPIVGQLVYMRTYEGIILLLFVHAIITLAVYQYFMTKCRARMTSTMRIESNQKNSGNMYFRHLHTQWK